MSSIIRWKSPEKWQQYSNRCARLICICMRQRTNAQIDDVIANHVAPFPVTKRAGRSLWSSLSHVRPCLFDLFCISPFHFGDSRGYFKLNSHSIFFLLFCANKLNFKGGGVKRKIRRSCIIYSFTLSWVHDICYFMISWTWWTDLKSISSHNSNPIPAQTGLLNSSDSVLKFERRNLWSDRWSV